MTDWAVIGVPTSAGAHHAGQELAPTALRAAGLLDRLRAAGLTVVDTGDLPGSRFAVDHKHPLARNADAVVAVAQQIATSVDEQLAAGRRPLVIGGDCTITIGAVAGFRRRGHDVGLAYVDGDADLGMLHPGRSGILDDTGISHLLGHGYEGLVGLNGDGPLLAPSRLAIVGCDPREVTAEDRRFLADAGVSYREAADLAADPDAVAVEALAALKESASGVADDARPVLVHFDVDVVDSGDLPLGNFPHYGSGVQLKDAVATLRVLLADPDCSGLVLTEVNPTYDPAGSQLDRYVDGLVQALSG